MNEILPVATLGIALSIAFSLGYWVRGFSCECFIKSDRTDRTSEGIELGSPRAGILGGRRN